MPATHKINHKKKLITTTWRGEATDRLLNDALQEYHRLLASEPALLEYDEIVDFSDVETRNISTQGLIQLTQLALNIDLDRSESTRMAIVVNSMLSFGLARMYEIYRGLSSNSKKELQVFRSLQEAKSWLIRADSCDS